MIDGDTVEADALVWPGHTVRVAIRIRGIDAPEMRGGCAAEKAAATDARERLAELLDDGVLQVSNIGPDKYFGRVVADLNTSSGDDVAGLLVSAAVVQPYDGRMRVAYCGG